MTTFEKIIAGELDGSFVYKDDTCVVFLDLHPLNPGHLLIVPRVPVARLQDLNGTTAAHLFLVAQRMLKALEASGLNYEGANIFLSDGEVAGQEVAHVHLHVLPRFAEDGIRISFGKSLQKADREELNRIAERISSQIK